MTTNSSTSTEIYRDQVRGTFRQMSDRAIAFQDARIVGGIDREEVESEKQLRGDRERLALVAECGRFCPCGIDLWHNGCYRCLKARGAVWTCDPAAEAAFHGRPNPYLTVQS